MADKLNYSATGHTITDEVVTTAETTRLAHDNFFELALYYDEAKTSAVSTDDYDLGEYDSTYSTNNTITFSAAFVSAHGTLYADYKTKGDYADAADVNAKADKVAPEAAGNIASLDVSGNLEDSGYAPDDFEEAGAVSTHESTYDHTAFVSDVSDKADKVDSATAGNFAGLDASGNLTDSSSKAADFATAGHNHSGTYEPADAAIQTHITAVTGNPHSVSKADVGLGNVDNTSDTDKPISTLVQEALDAKAAATHNHDTAYEPLDAAIQAHITATSGNPHSVSKTDVGLGNVDNTSDANKPISSAVSTALLGKSDTTHDHDGTYEPTLGNPDSDGKVLSSTAAGVRSWSDAGSGDMTKAVYDLDDDGIVGAAATLDDGTNSATAADVATAVTNSHTHANSAVLDGISADDVSGWDAAEANVQSDWSQADTGADDYIKNKPSIPDAFAIHSLDEVSTLAGADEFAVYDDTAGAHRRVTLTNLNAAIEHPITLDTAGDWTTSNPTPAAGEICVSSDTGEVKVGDGSTPWAGLPYVTAVHAALTGNGSHVPAAGTSGQFLAHDGAWALPDYYTDADAKAAVVNNSITDGNEDTAPSEDAVHTALAGKAASSHTHSASEVTDFDTEVGNNTTVTGKLDKAGGAMTGTLATVTDAQVRNIQLSTSDPTSGDGSNGDVWIKYTS